MLLIKKIIFLIFTVITLTNCGGGDDSSAPSPDGNSSTSFNGRSFFISEASTAGINCESALGRYHLGETTIEYDLDCSDTMANGKRILVKLEAFSSSVVPLVEAYNSARPVQDENFHGTGSQDNLIPVNALLGYDASSIAKVGEAIEDLMSKSRDQTNILTIGKTPQIHTYAGVGILDDGNIVPNPEGDVSENKDIPFHDALDNKAISGTCAYATGDSFTIIHPLTVAETPLPRIRLHTNQMFLAESEITVITITCQVFDSTSTEHTVSGIWKVYPLPAS